MVALLPVALVVFLLAVFLTKSIQLIGPTQVGLVQKRVGRKLPEDNPIAFGGEAGYQAKLLMPGLRLVLWPIFSVSKHPWVQVPAGEVGVVIAQVGAPLPIGAKSGFYHPAFGNFTDLRTFLASGGEKGVQRPVLTPGTLVPIHPIAFLVITSQRVFGLPVTPEVGGRGVLSPATFGLDPAQLRQLVIAPAGGTDVVGIVTTLEGEPLQSGDIASRLGGYVDITTMEGEGRNDAAVIDMLLGSQNDLHNNYQDFQRFLDAGGRIGLQHDPLA